MSDDRSYNGWTNYETWNANLWLDNDEGAYSHWKERAEALVAENDGDKDEAARELAKEMESECDEQMPEVSGMFADILRAALSEIDWIEIATHHCDEVEVEAGGA